MNSTISIVAVVVLMLVKMILTANFSALINARKSTLREKAEAGQKAAQRALTLGEDATHLLAAQQFTSILLSTTIVVTVALALLPSLEDNLRASGITPMVAQLLAFVLPVPLMSALLMIIDRLATSLVVGKRSDALAMLVARWMGWWINILSPIVLAVQRISGRTALLMGGSENAHLITEEEIKTLVDAGSEEGVLEDEEKEMIYSIIRFGDTVAREVMVPRIDIVALDIEATLDDALELIIKEGHSRIPVYRETIDNIEGVLYAKDLLQVWRDGRNLDSLLSLLREPYFVPETKSASELLVELQTRKTHLVFVVDEYGGTAGLLTMEDLVEEIVGEIQDEYDEDEEALYEEISEREYIFNARIDLDDLNHLLDVSIPTDESDTLGGYIFTELGRVPSISDEFTAHNLEFRVLAVTGRRIKKVQVRKLESVVDQRDHVMEQPSSNGVQKPAISSSVQADTTP